MFYFRGHKHFLSSVEGIFAFYAGGHSHIHALLESSTTFIMSSTDHALLTNPFQSLNSLPSRSFMLLVFSFNNNGPSNWRPPVYIVTVTPISC